MAPFGSDIRNHSEMIDRLLGYESNRIEQELLDQYQPYNKPSVEGVPSSPYEGTQTWIGLCPQALNTPYSEIVHSISYLKARAPKTVVDLGAGYGRVGVVLSSLLPDTKFIGYEVLSVRLREAERVFQKLGLKNCEMRCEDILDKEFRLPEAGVYFIYDFSDPHDLRVILKKLSAKLDRDKFFLIAKGKGIRSMIQLKYPEFWACNGAIHGKEWSIYSSYCDLNNQR